MVVKAVVSGFLLKSFDVTLRAGLHTGCVGLVRVDVHGESKTWIHTHEDISENKFAITFDPNAHGRFVANSISQRIGGSHMDMAQSANHSTLQLHAAV